VYLTSQGPPAARNDRTSLLVSGHNRSGMLHGLLEPFARHGVSMTRIESRTSRQALWEHIFYIDMEGHTADFFGLLGEPLTRLSLTVCSIVPR
jgi:chorismate mutase/prephenate dehydratase